DRPEETAECDSWRCPFRRGGEGYRAGCAVATRARRGRDAGGSGQRVPAVDDQGLTGEVAVRHREYERLRDLVEPTGAAGGQMAVRARELLLRVAPRGQRIAQAG